MSPATIGEEIRMDMELSLTSIGCVGFNLRFGSKVKVICRANRDLGFPIPPVSHSKRLDPTRCIAHALCGTPGTVGRDQGDAESTGSLGRLAKTAKADQTQVEFDRSSFVHSEVK